jgi:hypothetical protein
MLRDIGNSAKSVLTTLELCQECLTDVETKSNTLEALLRQRKMPPIPTIRRIFIPALATAWGTGGSNESNFGQIHLAGSYF